MRLQHNLAFLLSQDTAQEDVVAQRLARDEITDDFADGIANSYKVAPNTTKTINLPSASTKVLYIQSDLLLNVTINGGTAVAIKPRSKANVDDGSMIPAILYMMSDGIASVTVQNPDLSKTANVSVMAAD